MMNDDDLFDLICMSLLLLEATSCSRLTDLLTDRPDSLLKFYPEQKSNQKLPFVWLDATDIKTQPYASVSNSEVHRVTNRHSKVQQMPQYRSGRRHEQEARDRD